MVYLYTANEMGKIVYRKQRFSKELEIFPKIFTRIKVGKQKDHTWTKWSYSDREKCKLPKILQKGKLKLNTIISADNFFFSTCRDRPPDVGDHHGNLLSVDH